MLHVARWRLPRRVQRIFRAPDRKDLPRAWVSRDCTDARHCLFFYQSRAQATPPCAVVHPGSCRNVCTSRHWPYSVTRSNAMLLCTLSPQRHISVDSSTSAAKPKVSSGANTRTSFSRPQCRARWSFSTEHTPCSRSVAVWIGSPNNNIGGLQQQHNVTGSMCSQVVRTDFTPRDWTEKGSHYTIVIEAAIDNLRHSDELPLAPWY